MKRFNYDDGRLQMQLVINKDDTVIFKQGFPVEFECELNLRYANVMLFKSRDFYVSGIDSELTNDVSKKFIVGDVDMAKEFVDGVTFELNAAREKLTAAV